MLRSIDTLKSDGTWSAIDYTSGCTARRSSWPASGHWSRLLEMTAAYRGGLPRYKNNAHLRSAIHRAMGYWFDHDYSTIGDGSCMDREQFPAHHCPCGTPGLWGPNWYSNVILIPTRVSKVCILLRQELSDTELAKCTTMAARAYAPFYRDPKPGYLSGANVMDIAVIGIMAALLENDRSGNATRIADAYGRVHSQTLVQSENRVDGIKPDGSFQQHGGLIYDASAHVILLALNVGCSSNSFIQLSLLALGTQFQAKKEVQQSFGRWFEGARWMTYTNVMNNVVHWDLSVIGRFISYPVADGRASADLRMDLSQILKLGKAWSQRDLIEFGTRLTGSADNSANSGGLVGSRMFWNSDYMVHRTAETVTTVKMVSTRTTTSECVNSENPYGFHLSDGVTYTYSTGAEYEDIFAGLDYSIPPGITTDYAAAKLECATATRAGADSYAGGVEAGDVAMAAMRYLNPLSQSFGFYKAWFFFPNNVQHVLVANVQQYSQHSHPAFSVLDQRLRSGDVYLNGQSISEGGNFTETNTLWHSGTGYTFPPDQAISTPLSVCLQSKSGDWSKIGTSKRPPSIKDTFTAWLVHTPSSRTPTTHSSDPNTSAPIDTVRPRTIVNSEVVSAAMDSHATVLGAAFWKPLGGGISVKEMGVGLEVDRGVVVMVKFKDEGRTKGRIYVADPTHGSGTVTVKVNWLGQAISQRSAGEGSFGSECPGLKRTGLVQLNDHLQPRFLISTSMRRIGAYIECKTSKFKTKFKSATTSDVLSTSTLPSLSEALKTLQDGAGLDSKHRSEFESLARKLTSLSTSLNRHIKTSKSTHVSEFLERMAAQAEQDEKDIVEGYRRIAEILEELQTEASLKMWTIAEQQLADSRLEALSPAHAAAYNSSLSEEVNRRSCTEGTRANILLELNEWSLDSSKPNIFWMNGMAGTGKTTIAYTFAQSLRARGTLGASFFCTLLACVPVGGAQCVGARSNIKSQSITMVVIDALDECSSADGVGIILDVLFRVAPNLPVKFFVTSRPEPDIRLRVEAHSDQRRSIYLRDELPKSAVSESHMTQLANLSGSLFIYAATVVRYIRRKGNKIDLDRLEVVLSSSSKSGYQNADIDRLYTTILDAAIDDPEHEPEEQEQMRLMLWTAICTREPVNIDTLAALTGITATKADILLQPLYSVLHVSQGTNVVSTLHASFPDYMFDEARSARFYCDEAKHSHASLGRSRFEERSLRGGTGEVRRFSIASAAILDGGTKSQAHDEYRDQYAVNSQVMAKGGSPDSIKFLDDAWIFVSTVAAGSVSQSTPHIYISALAFCHPSSSVYKQTPVGTSCNMGMESSPISLVPSPDGIRFAIGFDDGAVCVVHAHNGALSLDPSRDIPISGNGTILVRDAQTGNRIYDVIKGMKDGESPIVVYTRPPAVTPLSFDANQSSVYSIAFSPNGNNLVTGHRSGDLRVWSLHNGTATHSPPKRTATPTLAYLAHTTLDFLRGVLTRRHTSRIMLKDGVKMWNPLHSTSSHTPKWNAPTRLGYDNAIYMFNARNGTATVEPLVAHTDWVRSMAFSPMAGTLHPVAMTVPSVYGMARAASCYSVHFKGIKTRFGRFHSHPMASALSLPRMTRPYECGMWRWHSDAIDLVGTHETWSIVRHFLLTAGTLFLAAEMGRSVWQYLPVTFSPDGQLVASGSDDGTICVFDSRSGDLVLGPLKRHERSVQSVVFSPDGSHIVSGSFDGSVRVWVVKDGAPACEPLRGHQDGVNSVTYSPDGRYIVSGSDDSTVRVWKAPGGGVVSDLSHSTPSASDERQTHRAIAGGLTVSKDGWVRNRDSQLLFWAPSDVRRVFPSVGQVYTIGPEGTLHTTTASPCSSATTGIDAM
ncbi:Polysaccharide lyase family 8, N terminal alpha-helical domain [Rhizoctonia solani]|uniref:Polysaccharide lyase family 8, N terminal alpha-helical domain n=1 Tax=Rhizoctonia solani TaxID=456999 RepID=A0A8H7I465_9AGAM|nr:Polysaccharide lyase family 8, N terminal alpha-helical domain [Rhizoctonia solani]